MTRPSAATVLAIAALTAFVLLSVASLLGNSPTSDEPVHLTAGYTHLHTRDYRMNPEHPPLVKLLAAVSLSFVDVRPPWPSPVWQEAWRSVATRAEEQWRLANIWLYRLNDSKPMFRAGRVPTLLLGLAAGVVVFLWSRELWGASGAAASTILFAFDPSFIAHSALITTDVALAAFSIATLYFFWRGNAAGFIAAFALAQTAKFSAVLLLPIVIALALWRYATTRRDGRKLIAMIAGAGVASIAAIWLAYGLRYSASADGAGPLPTEEIVRQWEANEAIARLGPGAPATDIIRARQTARPSSWKSLLLVAQRSRLLPEAYLHGIAVAGASSALRPAFLNGEISRYGFPSYFFWTTLYKTPVPILLALIVGVVIAVRRNARQVMFLLVPALIFFAVASASRFNIGHRHVLQVFPFLYVACGAIGAAFAEKNRRGAIAGGVAAIAVAVSSNFVFAGRPDAMIGRHLSYLNELAGGPRRGFWLLNDSNFDWGQDLGRLGQWLDEHGVEEPIDVVYFGTAEPRAYGIRFRWGTTDRPPLRIVAISSAAYIGLFERPDQRDRWQRYLADSELVGRAGYSIFVFRTTSP